MIDVAELLALSAQEHGWRVLIVGGWVRDFIDMVEPSDLDVELSCEDIDIKCTPELVRNWLNNIATNVKEVGKAFGVFDFSIDGIDVQVSLPRTDSKVGRGHTGFVVNVNPYMSPHEASLRRDITQNAASYNPITHEVFDFHRSIEHIKEGRIKVIDPIKFGDDPLRVMRLARFVTRKPEYVTDSTTLSACMRSVLEYNALPKDRIWGEWRKISLGKYPGNALRFMRDSTLIKVFPVLERLYDIQQGITFHPEGAVWFHAINTMNKMAMICDRDGVSDEERVVAILSAMLHDVGKDSVDLNDKTINYDHFVSGAVLSEKFLKNIGAPNSVCLRVYKLIETHMRGVGSKKATRSMVRRLARDISPETITQWLRLREADRTSRYMDAHIGLSKSACDVARHAKELAIEKTKQKPILMGRHLLDFGMAPGPDMGVILGAAYEAQLNGEIETLDDALLWVDNRTQEKI